MLSKNRMVEQGIGVKVVTTLISIGTAIDNKKEHSLIRDANIQILKKLNLILVPFIMFYKIL